MEVLDIVFRLLFQLRYSSYYSYKHQPIQSQCITIYFLRRQNRGLWSHGICGTKKAIPFLGLPRNLGKRIGDDGPEFTLVSFETPSWSLGRPSSTTLFI
jgi:hypothetical protein